VVAILASVSYPALAHGTDTARASGCTATMRRLASAVLAYTTDNAGAFPRSSHSAGAYGEPGWARSILPYLGEEPSPPLSRWRQIQQRVFRCRSDTKRASGLSYGINVYFELDPGYDDYPGAPQTWRRVASLARPSRTLLLAEVPSSADHVMSHFWEAGGSGGDVAGVRHQGRANYAFADGHTERLTPREVYDADTGLDLWNPSLAR